MAETMHRIFRSSTVLAVAASATASAQVPDTPDVVLARVKAGLVQLARAENEAVHYRVSSSKVGGKDVHFGVS